MGELIAIVATVAALGAAPEAPRDPHATPVTGAVQRPADPWLGPDKFQHVGVSWGVTVFAFGGARSAGIDRDASLGVAITAAAFAGIAKEIADARRGARISVRDLAADALGIGAAFLFLREVR